MDVLTAMRTLNACRYYKTDPVSEALVAKVLNEARWAASGSNNQPLSYVVVRDAAKRRALHDLYQPIWDGVVDKYRSGDITAGFDKGFIKHVDHFARHISAIPVLIVVCADLSRVTAIDANLGRQPLTGGASIYPAVQNLMLAARNEGLGTVLTTLWCLVEPEVKALLDIPAGIATAAVITLGWPAKPFPQKLRRRSLGECAHLDSYGTPLPGTEPYDQ